MHLTLNIIRWEMSPGKNIAHRDLSGIDRRILKILLSPNGEMKSTVSIAEKMWIPVTTVRRRRKRLEKDFLKVHYVLHIEKFGWRRVDFFISILQGKVNQVASNLMNLNDVTYVGKSIGEHTIDLRVETIVKDNSVLLNLLEEIKSNGWREGRSMEWNCFYCGAENISSLFDYWQDSSSVIMQVHRCF